MDSLPVYALKWGEGSAATTKFVSGCLGSKTNLKLIQEWLQLVLFPSLFPM